MKNFVLFVFLFLPGMTLLGETPSADKIEFGRILKTDEIIWADRNTMPGLVYDHKVYPNTGTIVYTLLSTNKKETRIKPKGTLAGYSIDNSEKRWEQDFTLTTDYVSFEDQFIVRKSGAKNSPFRYLFPMTGYELTSLRKIPMGFIETHNILLSADMTDGPRNNVLYGHTLEGQKIWERKVKKNFNWTDYELIDESSILVSGSGLFRIDLTDGQGWELSAVTHNTDKKARGSFWASVGAAMLGGAVAGLAGGGVVYVPGGAMTTPSKLTDISSNMCMTDTYVYWAGKENIYKIDIETGEVKWERPLPENTSSSSYLVIHGRHLYMFNMGTVNSYTGKRKFGTPYVAKFEASTGELEFRTELADGIRNFFWDRELKYLFVFTADNNILKLSASSGEINSSTAPDDTEKNYFAVRRDMMKKDDASGKYIPLTGLYNNNTLFMSDGEEVLCYDESLCLIDSFPLTELFVPYADIDSYVLLTNYKTNIIIDIWSDPVAEIKHPGRLSLAGSLLLATDRKEVYSIDLADVLPEGIDVERVLERGTEIHPYEVVY